MGALSAKKVVISQKVFIEDKIVFCEINSLIIIVSQCNRCNL